MNYEDAGFDSFLSRSIDNVLQANLEARGPFSSQTRYDSTQLSGIIGDRFKVGSILIDGVAGSLTINDGSADSLLLQSKDSSGEISPALKIAPRGIDANDASSDELDFSTSEKRFKILKSDDIVMHHLANTVSFAASVEYDFGYVPDLRITGSDPRGYTEDTAPWTGLPQFSIGSSGEVLSLIDASVSKKQLQIVMFTPNIVGNNSYTQDYYWYFTYYLLQPLNLDSN